MKNKKIYRRVLALFVYLALIVSIFLSGYTTSQRGINLPFGPKGVINSSVGKSLDVDFSIFWEAWNKLKKESVKDISSEKMIEGAIAGLLSSANDPFTVFFSKDENKRFRDDIKGEFSGIGVELIQKNGLPTVVAPLSESPAEKAGMKAGDVVIEVDGAKTNEIGFDETINRIRGTEGSTVKLMISREDEKDALLFEIKRSKISVKSVEWEVKNYQGKKISYIKIRQFGDDTESLFEDAAKDALDKNASGMIIDLRNNPGGYLETAVNIASYFIKDGVIVSEKGKDDVKKEYNAQGKAKLDNLKVAVLTNEGSASASEILAGALQDRKGSKIIGEKTFGKGSVQELYDLSDGSAVKITVASWYTPNGRQINGEGIKPDIEIKDNEASKTDEQLDRVLQYLAVGN